MVQHEQGKEGGGVCEEEQRAAHPEQRARPRLGRVVGGAPVGEEVDHQVGLIGRLCASSIRLKKKDKERGRN